MNMGCVGFQRGQEGNKAKGPFWGGTKTALGDKRSWVAGVLRARPVKARNCGWRTTPKTNSGKGIKGIRMEQTEGDKSEIQRRVGKARTE